MGSCLSEHGAEEGVPHKINHINIGVAKEGVPHKESHLNIGVAKEGVSH
jgi:hypothetical protein